MHAFLAPSHLFLSSASFSGRVLIRKIIVLSAEVCISSHLVFGFSFLFIFVLLAACPGDSDPLDAIELSPEPLTVGRVVCVRILGAFALIDQGEADWKILTIHESNPLARCIQCRWRSRRKNGGFSVWRLFSFCYSFLSSALSDIEHLFPGLLHHIREWLRVYKVPEGKQPNTFASEQPFDHVCPASFLPFLLHHLCIMMPWRLCSVSCAYAGSIRFSSLCLDFSSLL